LTCLLTVETLFLVCFAKSGIFLTNLLDIVRMNFMGDPVFNGITKTNHLKKFNLKIIPVNCSISSKLDLNSSNGVFAVISVCQ